MTTANTTIVKIQLDNPANKFIILKTTWSAAPFRLDIMLMDEEYRSIASSDEYTGELSMDQIEAVANALDATIEELLSETKVALGSDDGSPLFSYELKSDRFVWHKNGILKMCYGAVELSPAYNTGCDLLLTSLQLKADYKSGYDRVRNELTATKRHHEQIKAEYDRFVADQVEKEEQTLTKFLALLNEKKAKIGQLENLLSQLRGDGDVPMNAVDGRNYLGTEEDRTCDVSEKQSIEPSTSEGEKRLPKRKKFNKNQAETTVEVAATNQVQAVTDPGSSTRATVAIEQKLTESTQNLSQDSVFSKDTEEMCADMWNLLPTGDRQTYLISKEQRTSDPNTNCFFFHYYFHRQDY